MSSGASEAREVLSATADLEVRWMSRKEAPSPVAIYYGLELKLLGRGSAAFLACSANQCSSGFFVKGAQPSDEDQHRIQCPHCSASHYVVSLLTALEEGKIDFAEAGPIVAIEDVFVTLLREAETGLQGARRRAPAPAPSADAP